MSLNKHNALVAKISTAHHVRLLPDGGNTKNKYWISVIATSEEELHEIANTHSISLMTINDTNKTVLQGIFTITPII